MNQGPLVRRGRDIRGSLGGLGRRGSNAAPPTARSLRVPRTPSFNCGGSLCALRPHSRSPTPQASGGWGQLSLTGRTAPALPGLGRLRLGEGTGLHLHPASALPPHSRLLQPPQRSAAPAPASPPPRWKGGSNPHQRGSLPQSRGSPCWRQPTPRVEKWSAPRRG